MSVVPLPISPCALSPQQRITPVESSAQVCSCVGESGLVPVAMATTPVSARKVVRPVGNEKTDAATVVGVN